jgi:hypothetical protein
VSINGSVWTPIGPSPITESGRPDNGMTTAIAVNPNDGDVVYQGTAGGGVWKTRDGGTTWRPLFDQQHALGIGEPAGIAIDPNDTDTVYVGTTSRGRVSPQRQSGLFKSIDGGASWVQLGSGYPAGISGNASQFTAQNINSIIVDPANSQIVYLASGNGVYRSTDGGRNWIRGAGSAGDARSLVLDTTSPANARILYAGVSGSNSGGVVITGSVIRSTNGGANWTQILTSTTAAVQAALTAGGATMNQVVIDLAPPTSPPAAGGIRVMYAAIAANAVTPPATATDPVGLFMSTDQGATWTKRWAPPTGGPGTTYNGYTMTLAVDPASPGDGKKDTLYFGTSSQGMSTDSGASFTPLTGLHADTHAWGFARTATIMYCGTDGGFSRSTDGTTWINSQRNAGGLQTTLFYNIDIKPDGTAGETAGALQDNNIELSKALPGWTSVTPNDGWDVVYDGVTTNRLFATQNATANPKTRLLRSTDGGANFPDITPWSATGSENGLFLASLAADPATAGNVYVMTSQNLWQTRDGGNNWRTIGSFPAPGNGFITAKVAVAPTNGNNVVVANGTQVWVSTNALGPPNGVTFTDITLPPRPLPGNNVLRAAFDPNDPTVIYAVLGGFGTGHVFRTTVGGTAWTDISPPLDVPYGALALDGADTPTTIYVGTDFGVLRSVDRGASWYVLDDLHFPKAPVTDLVIGRGTPVLRAATYGRGVFEFAKPNGPTIAVDPEAGLGFGTVCGKTSLKLHVFNVGTGDLVISSVQRLMGSAGFRVLPNPGTPLVLAAGEDISFTVQFDPTTPGTEENATIRIVSNDPGAPVVDLLATGTGGIAALVTVIPDNGDFGEVCLGSFSDRDVIVANSGRCALTITGITSSSGEFLVPSVLSYPLTIAPGNVLEAPIRFQPTSIGSKSSMISVLSNDPTGPKTVVVSGTAPAPRLTLVVPNTGDFGEVRLGTFVDRDLVINNRGPCPLSVTGIVSSAPVVFVIPSVVSFPLAVEGGDSIAVPIRFQPTNRGSATATLTIVSNDPNSPAVVNVSGTAWPPLPIAGTALTGFPLNDNSQHVFFIGTDKYVHELDIAVGGIWADNDLTTLAGAVPPTPTSALAGFPLGPALGPNTKHGFFIGTDNHVYELYFTAGTGWVFNDLTSLARAVPPTPTSALAGHSLGDDSKHVFFIGTDNHVHELFIAGGGRWADNDLTTLAGVGAKPPTPASALASYRLGDDSQHVFFIGTDNHVHELFIAGAGWHDNDLTALAGAVAPAAASALTGYRLVGDDSLHVFFIGTDNHVHELFFAGGSWAANDLTALAGAVPPTPTSALTGYRLGDDSQHVFFIGTDSHVHELDIAGAGWHDHDLTTLAGAVAPTPASALTGYPLGDNSKHVFFIGTDDHVHELFFAGAGWLDNDLTALT